EEIAAYEHISSLVDKLSGMREATKATTLINKATDHGKILCFDSTVITLEYLQKLIDEAHTGLKTIVATGQSLTNKNAVMDALALGSSNVEPLIALCSDAMSEGINLQHARALVLLDMPSVLRIIEQRIGRIDRMDSD